MVVNGMADCFTVRKRTTRLKCVNSEDQFVCIHPEKGSFKWVHGTLLEQPWEITLDKNWINEMIGWKLNPNKVQPHKIVDFR